MVPKTLNTNEWQYSAWRNHLHTFLLLTSMAAFLALLGWLVWGREGIVLLVLFGLLAIAITPRWSPWLVMRLYGAAEISSHHAPELYRIVTHLAHRAQLRTVPALFYVPSQLLNAFAVGHPQRSAIAITDGLLRQLTHRELTAVLAHEVSHVRNRDLRVMGLADLISRFTHALSLTGQLLLLINLPMILFSDVTINWLLIVLLIFAPAFSGLAQLALSRTREYDADLNAVRLTGDPEGLVSALRKMEQIQGRWLEQIMMPGQKVPDPSILRTHPATEDRVDRLVRLKSGEGEDLLSSESKESDYSSIFTHGKIPKPRRRIHGLWY